MSARMCGEASRESVGVLVFRVSPARGSIVVAGGNSLNGWNMGPSSSEGGVGIPTGPTQKAGLQGWDVAQNTGYQWSQGQNMGGVENSFDNPWYSKWLPEYQAAIDDGSVGTYFLDKRSGIAQFDQTGTDSKGQQQTVRAGDMFDDGKLLGNLYDTYGKDAADQIMAPLMLKPDEVKAGVTVEQKIAENSTSWANAQGQ